jgi:hypothetical protein
MNDLKIESLLTEQDIPARIKAVSVGTKANQAELHLILCSTLQHISLHGNTTNAVELLNSIANGLRVKSMDFWYRKFSGGAIGMKLDAKTKVWSCKMKDGWNASTFDIVGAMATSFADASTEKAQTTLTLDDFKKYLTRVSTTTSLNKDGSYKVAKDASTMAAKLLAHIASLTPVATDAAA